MGLNDVSLDQWQDVDNLIKMVRERGLSKTNYIQLSARLSAIRGVLSNFYNLYSDCLRITDIFNEDKNIIDDINKDEEILGLLKNISKEYKPFIKAVCDSDGYKICKTDNLTTRYYRHLQTKWRESKGLPVKKGDNQSNEEVYGNYTSDPYGNFMTPNIIKLVNDEIANKGDRVIEETRLRENLLSSQPLCFNLFGELKLNKKKALLVFNKIYDDYFSSIDEILFEYNPARRDPRLTGDRSAFDVFVEYTSKFGKRGFIGIEVKYSETLREGADKVKDTIGHQFCDEQRTRKDRYEELSKGLFSSDNFNKLEKLPYFQIWRDHLLAVAMCKAFPEKYDEGFFCFLSPHTNELCRNGVTEYKELLLVKDRLESHFDIKWLEDFIDTLNIVFNEDWTHEMGIRYLGRHPKSGIFELKCRKIE